VSFGEFRSRESARSAGLVPALGLLGCDERKGRCRRSGGLAGRCLPRDRARVCRTRRGLLDRRLRNDNDRLVGRRCGPDLERDAEGDPEFLKGFERDRMASALDA